MAIVKYAVCEGCGAIQVGDTHPEGWPEYQPSDGSDATHYCTDDCARMSLSSGEQTTHAVRLHALGLQDEHVVLLRLVATGHSNKEIARQLGRAESTVKNRLLRISTQLHTRDRYQTTLMAHALGVINLNTLSTNFLAEHRRNTAK